MGLAGHLANKDKSYDGSCNGLRRRATRHQAVGTGTGASTSYAANLIDSHRFDEPQTRATLQRQLENDIADKARARKEDAECKRLIDEAHLKDGDTVSLLG